MNDATCHSCIPNCDSGLPCWLLVLVVLEVQVVPAEEVLAWDLEEQVAAVVLVRLEVLVAVAALAVDQVD